jgi:hypothetical protein
MSVNHLEIGQAIEELRLLLKVSDHRGVNAVLLDLMLRYSKEDVAGMLRSRAVELAIAIQECVEQWIIYERDGVIDPTP